MNQVNNLQELNELVLEDSKKNKDLEISVKDIMWVGDRLLVAGSGSFTPTRVCLDQLCAKVGIMPTTAEWLQQNHSAEFNSVMQREVSKWVGSESVDRRMFLRLREVGGELKARALLSPRYGVMDNNQAVEVLKNSLPESFHKLKFNGMKNQALINPETGRMNCKVLVPAVMPDTTEDPHSFGFVITNDETGRGSLEVSAQYIRAFCTNQLRGLGNIAKYRHIGYNRFESIQEDFSGLVRDTAVTANKQFEAYWNTRDRKVENAEEFLLREGNLLKLPKKALKAIISEGRLLRNVKETGSTVYSVIQSMTEFARDLEDAATAELFELAAGSLVTMNRG